MAGKMLNFDDERSKLFFTFADLIDHYRAKNPNLIFLLENVKMESWCQEVISERLGVDPVLINGALVSAQNRERLWWTNLPIEGKPKDKGILLKDILEPEVDKKYYVSEKVLARLDRRNYSDAKINPDKTGTINCKNNSAQMSLDSGTTLIAVINNDGELSERDKSTCIDANYHKGMDNHGQRTLVLIQPNIFGGDRIHEDKAPTILSNPEGGTKNPFVGIRETKDGFHQYRDDEKKSSIQGTHVTYPDGKVHCVTSAHKPQTVEPFLAQRIMRGEDDQRTFEGKSPTLTAYMGTGGNNVPYVNNIRRLTETEAERLFTLPDGYTEGVSSTQRYRCLGNGWVVDVSAWIFSFIGQPLRNHRRQPKLF